MAKELKETEFEELVVKASKPVVVDFWAQWCGPCRMLGPIIGELSTEMADVVDIYKCNVDENRSLAAKFNIMSIPSILIFKGGELVANRMGAASKSVIKEWIEQHI